MLAQDGAGGGGGGGPACVGGGAGAPPRSENRRPLDAQSSPPPRVLPCAERLPWKREPARTVSWAKTTGCSVAPFVGSMKKTAPFSELMPACSVQSPSSMPMVLSAPDCSAGPSMPICNGDAFQVSEADKCIEKAAPSYCQERVELGVRVEGEERRVCLRAGRALASGNRRAGTHGRGLTGPTSEPNGGSTWNAGGKISGSPSSPYSAYTSSIMSGSNSTATVYVS